MEPRISIITLGVHDLVRATAFYQKGLGLPLSEKSNENISFFELKGSWLALYPAHALAADADTTYVENKGFRGFSLAHNVASPEEVDQLLKKIEQAGGIIVKQARKADWGGYSGYFTDLDGYYWEVAHNPFWIIP